jgi:hypothetical protein
MQCKCFANSFVLYSLRNNKMEKSPYMFSTDAFFLSILNNWLIKPMNMELTDPERWLYYLLNTLLSFRCYDFVKNLFMFMGNISLLGFFSFLLYSYVHTMFGSFLSPSLCSLPYPRQPFTTRQKLFCPYL